MPCCLDVYRMVDIAVCNYQQGVEAGLSQVEAWQQSTCDWVVAAKVGRSAGCFVVPCLLLPPRLTATMLP